MTCRCTHKRPTYDLPLQNPTQNTDLPPFLRAHFVKISLFNRDAEAILQVSKE